METLQEDIVRLIKEHYSSDWEVDIFKDHIIINLRDKREDYRPAYQQVKQEITKCIRQHFPEREAELLFEVRTGSWNFSFKLGKTMTTVT
jgi:hypothetical protein